MATDAPPAEDALRGVSARLEIIANRSDFLRAAKARSKGTAGFHLQARNRGDDGPARVGFTCSKKVGNAVARNRAKRRLREIARLDLTPNAQPGWDYVLIGRRDITAQLPFDQMRADLRRALAAVSS